MQLASGAGCLNFCLSFCLCFNFVCASSEGLLRLQMLVGIFTTHISHELQNLKNWLEMFMQWGVYLLLFI